MCVPDMWGHFERKPFGPLQDYNLSPTVFGYKIKGARESPTHDDH